LIFPMHSKERLLKALNREMPDRLPVTTHHVMPSFLDTYMEGTHTPGFFEQFGLDPIHWAIAYAPDTAQGEYHDPDHQEPGFLEARRICADQWRFQVEELKNREYLTHRFKIITPKKVLSMVLQSDAHTTWVAEHLIKEKSDIDLIAKYMTRPKCDVKAINEAADQEGERALIRGHIACFDGFGQPGCWQDFSCLYGSTNLIMASMEDPAWVHAFLEVLRERKKTFIHSLKGARYDLLELGGGDASTTVISPDLFNEFVAPYDAELIASAHAAGQKIVYHTCGGMMPILEDVAAMKPDAMETFTPVGMGGDARLAEAKSRIGDKVCMIGGFDQFHFFTGCSEEETRREVRRCFREAGGGGGYILSPSDHFFEADLKLLEAFADEARNCTYETS
jgi:uroporphyrinogen decarboxylase